ncbi:hypothetical protein KIN20_001516 [Parelaphostrongylus tenuis]|uniref:IMD domain-containing protein n=1 Tax=Parelaphostrongylus tenuis TaxID=148309 RepID=A0AAD5QG92_PARTN|nr:hypothetical protein KIN20_001516 [Parelaphostrongylus tenuis]
MDPDMEFNALSALYQSVIQDMKQSYPVWEMVGQRAQKLSAQLKATASCLAGFMDSIQAVSDYANNLRGAARDMGVCMTRVCMRERALEHRLRAVADALSDETAVSIQQRAAYWKQRTAELDKSAAKHVKKIRTRKGRPDPAAVSEQRQLCSQVLGEQRTQFAFFIGTLMPVFTAEIALLDEGSHIRQVVENLDSTVKLVDGSMLVQTILSDLSQGADNAWRQCLTNAVRVYRSSGGDSMNGDGGGLSTRATTPGSSFSHEDNDMTPQAPRPAYNLRSDEIQLQPLEKNIIKARYTPPLETPTTQQQQSNHQHVPPSSFRPTNGSQFDIGLTTNGRIQRPQSFTGELRTTFAQTPTFGSTPPVYRPGSSSCSSSDAASSAALIAETLQQIDQLGSDLESYCVAADQQNHSNHQRIHTEYAALRGVISNGCDTTAVVVTNGNTSIGPPENTGSVFQNGIRMRAEGSSRPPPPTRRSSTITAATPTAPSVVEARMGMGSIMGSRQSLNSTGLYCPLGSNQDLRYSNVNPYNRAAPNYKI